MLEVAELIKTIDWEVVVAALGTVIAAIIGIMQIRANLPKPRSRLKMDIEIMNLLDKNDDSYKIVQKSIFDQIAETYKKERTLEPNEKLFTKFLQIISFLLGSVCLVWSINITRSGWNLWVLLTGYFSFAFYWNTFTFPLVYRRIINRRKKE
jgi:hypothetical protein